jgi:hypothetical protein
MGIPGEEDDECHLTPFLQLTEKCSSGDASSVDVQPHWIDAPKSAPAETNGLLIRRFKFATNRNVLTTKKTSAAQHFAAGAEPEIGQVRQKPAEIEAAA